jgi:hypothetical protein
MSDFVGVDIRGMEQVAKLLKNLPIEVQNAASDDVADYMLNVERLNPPYQYISRAQAYPNAQAGPGWFSAKQRKYVMAKIRSGEIAPGSPHRTQTFSRGWRKEDKGVNAFLVNEVPYGIHLKDPRANHMKLIGWKTIAEDIEKNMNQIMRKAEAAVQKAIRKLGG